VKRVFAILLASMLLLPVLTGCYCNGREIPPSEYGETVLLGQLDRYETDADHMEWAVISIDMEPYSVCLKANEEINSETVMPGAWINVFYDGDYPYAMCLAVIV
jgi:hypothetical protein